MELQEEEGLFGRRRLLRKRNDFLEFVTLAVLPYEYQEDEIDDPKEKELVHDIYKRDKFLYFRAKWIFTTTLRERIYYQPNYKLLDKEVTIFIASNFLKILARYSYPVPKTREDSNYLFYYKDGEMVTLKLKDDFYKKYFKDIKLLYEEYINSHQNVEFFDCRMLYKTFINNRLLDIDVDNILDEYKNLTRQDVLKLCIYHLSDDLFIKYLGLLNKCSEEEKNIIFEFIKPLRFYYSYAPKYYTLPTDKTHGNENTTDFFSFMYDYLACYVFDGNEEYEKCIFSDKDTVPDVKYDIPLEDAQEFFKEIYYFGYSVFIATFGNLFLNQYELLDKIISNHDMNALYKLISAKRYLVDNPIKTEFEIGPSQSKYHKGPVAHGFDKSKILELKENYLEFCSQLIDDPSKANDFGSMKLTRKNKE